MSTKRSAGKLKGRQNMAALTHGMITGQVASVVSEKRTKSDWLKLDFLNIFTARSKGK